jgi:serine/threonine protein kinase
MHRLAFGGEKRIKYVGYEMSTVAIFGGNYAPPHKGHFENVVNQCNSLKAYVGVMCVTANSDRARSRYGVSASDCCEVLRAWAVEISPKWLDIIVVDMNVNPTLRNIVPPTSKNVIEVVTCENETEYVFELVKRLRLSPMYLPGVPRNIISKHCSIRSTWPSSTKFVQCLLRGKPSECFSFTPDGLSDNSRMNFLVHMANLVLEHKLSIVLEMKPCAVSALEKPVSSEVYSCIDHVKLATDVLRRHMFLHTNGAQVVDLLAYGANGWVFNTTRDDTICKVDIDSPERLGLSSQLGYEAGVMRVVMNERIPVVIDTGSIRHSAIDGKLVYMFMERHGDTIRAWMKRHPPSSERIAHLRREMRSVLGAIHKKGYIHRDVHPGNLLLRRGTSIDSEKPELVLIDFGLATEIKYQNIGGVQVGTAPYNSVNAMEMRRQGPDDDMESVELILYEYAGHRIPRDVNGKRALGFSSGVVGATEIVTSTGMVDDDEVEFEHGYKVRDTVKVLLSDGRWVGGVVMGDVEEKRVRVKYIVNNVTTREYFTLDKIRPPA